MEARKPEGSEAGAKRAAGGTITTGSAGKRVCPSGSGAAAGATSATSKSDICQHQRERSTCKECGGAGICQRMLLMKTCDFLHDPYLTDPKQSFSAIMVLGDAR